MTGLSEQHSGRVLGSENRSFAGGGGHEKEGEGIETDQCISEAVIRESFQRRQTSISN